jgi:putative SOS response-associated peptidase YedK
MCNLQRLTKASGEIARLFGAVLQPSLGPIAVGNLGNVAADQPGETYPGQPGLVVARGRTGDPTLTAMTWGFPFAATGKQGQKLKPRPVNNARADKLTSFMWRDSFAKRRCLIPLTAFAEAEGEAGAKTRTWFSLPEEQAPEGLFAAAGLWRQTDEWGLAYTMVMTEACVHVADVHDRMPVILRPRDWLDWLDGAPDAAGLLCRPWPELMVVERTGVSWVRR